MRVCHAHDITEGKVIDTCTVHVLGRIFQVWVLDTDCSQYHGHSVSGDDVIHATAVPIIKLMYTDCLREASLPLVSDAYV